MKYIDANTIYAAWMIRNKSLSITNHTLCFLNSEFVETLKRKGEYMILNLGEYDKEYFIKNSLGLICKETTTPNVLMSLIGKTDMASYLDISNTIEETDTKDGTINF